MYNTAPLKSFLSSNFKGKSIEREISVGLVDMLAGKYREFTKTELTSQDAIINAMYASLSYVGFYPPAEAFGSSFVDGAAVWDIDIPAAINKCYSLGYTDNTIVVDVIMTTNKVLPFEDTTDKNSLQILYRYLQIARYYGAMDGITRARFAYPDVEFRHVVAPSTKLPHNWEPLVSISLFICLENGLNTNADHVRLGSR